MNSSPTAHTPRRRPGRLVFVAAAFLLSTLSLASCDRPTDGRGGALVVAGSTSVQPFAEKLAEEYMALHSREEINVQGGGSTAGIRAVVTGAAGIGMSSRELKPDEKVLHETVIAHDGIAIIVHSSNPVADLSLDQISRVFAGQIVRWDQLGAGSGEIHFVTREEGSGTRSAFEEKVMGNRSIAPRALVQDSNGAVREIVANDPHALGYISLGLVDDRVKALSVHGVRPSRESILNGSYAVVRPFLFLTRTAPAGTGKRFIDYILGRDAQRLLEAEGLIPVQE